MVEGALQCSACGEPIPRTSRLQDDGTHVCPHCGERVDALPRFLGAGRGGADTEERTDDPITMPAIPASAFEPAVPVAFTGKHRWKPRKDGPVFVHPDEDPPEPGEVEGLRPDPTPAFERVSHEIEAPAPPPVLRADSIPPISQAPPHDLPAADEPADLPRVRPPRQRESAHPRQPERDEPPLPRRSPSTVPAGEGPPKRRMDAEPPPRAEAPRAEALRAEAPRALRPEPTRSHPPRSETPRSQAPRAEAVRRDPPEATPAPMPPRAARTPLSAAGSRPSSTGAPAPALQASPPPKSAVVAVDPVEDDGNERYTVTESGGVLVVEWRWFGLGAIVLGLAASCWTGLLTGWVIAFFYLLSSGGLAILVVAVGGAVHAVVAAAVCYIALARFMNHTRVRVSGGGIEVAVGPLRWRGGRSVPVGSVARLALTERGHQTYDLAAVLTQGGQVPIVQRVHPLEEAKRLEELVARYLGNPALRSGGRKPGGSAGSQAKKTG